MTTSTQVKLIGGPFSNRSYEVPADSQPGQVFVIGGAKQRAANVTVETQHHYRLDPHPSEGFVLSWVNPMDRRSYGS